MTPSAMNIFALLNKSNQILREGEKGDTLEKEPGNIVNTIFINSHSRL